MCRLKQLARWLAPQHITTAGGIEPTRVLAVGYGESSPLASNNDVNGRLLNRRVVAEIQVPSTVLPPSER